MHSKKHLSFSAIRNMIAENLAMIKDTRAANSSNTIVDVMLSGLACMYYQSPSLLEFQRKMEKKEAYRERENKMCGLEIKTF